MVQHLVENSRPVISIVKTLGRSWLFLVKLNSILF